MSTSNNGRGPSIARGRVPGRRSRGLGRRLGRVECRNITLLSDEFPIFWDKASGCHVEDADGRRFLDLTSAFGVSSLGHRAPAVEKAMRRQISRLWHGMGDVHPSEVKVRLLEVLADISPGALGVTILATSGAEAVEAAAKTAVLATGKAGMMAFSGAYHGLTYGTLALTHRDDFRSPFQRQLASGVSHVPYPDALRGVSADQSLSEAERCLRGASGRKAPVGGVFVEPVQGRGGVRVPPRGFLRELGGLCRRYGALLIADEIFTGFGRTGRRFAVEHDTVVPDLMCVGKAMANGFPISACIGRRDVMRAWPVSDGEAIHTSTFLGHPLGCAMALAAIEDLERRNLARRAAEVGFWWKRRLQERLGGHPRVAEIRGAGLMIGIELVRDRRGLQPDGSLAVRVMTEALRRGLILLTCGADRNVLSLTPPLVISRRGLERATDILEGIFHGVP